MVVGSSLEANLRVPPENALPDRARLHPWRLAEGWARPTPDGVWATSLESRIEFTMVAAPARQLVFEARAYHGLERPLTVTPVLNGEAVATVALAPRWQMAAVPIPEGTLADGANRLLLRFSERRSPRSAGLGADSRQLAAFVRRVAILPAGVDRLPPDQRPGVRIEDDHWHVTGPGRLNLPLLADRPFERISLRLPDTVVVQGAPVRIVVPTGGHDDLELQAQGATELSLRLPAPTAQAVLEIPVGPGEARMDRPQLTLTPARLPPEARMPAAGRPDVVVLILDAVRASSCGFAGYHRRTTPAIDAIAAGATVFTRVSAQAPYTACSVPTMLTGVGFPGHQVLGNRDRLADPEITLAEILRDSGYRTLGFSGTPNNSPRIGTGQGYEIFDDVWRLPDFATSIDPHVLADRVVSAVTDLDERPLHLMVHWVPPHSPYTPAERFRRWNDPEYDGPCDGGQRYLASITNHPERVSEADLAELIALYDANLLAADDALGQVVRALQRAGRWDDALVVITSDHGEAFFEHGERSHNSTVYEEMLRVPLILKRPGQTTPERHHHLVSLEDLVPTILGELGLEPPERVTGMDALGSGAREGLLLRSASQQRLTGLIWGEAKIIADRWHDIDEVYDLAADPGEQTNLMVIRPDLTVLLAALWDRELSRQPPSSAGESGELSDEERAMLEGLGYLDN